MKADWLDGVPSRPSYTNRPAVCYVRCMQLATALNANNHHCLHHCWLGVGFRVYSGTFLLLMLNFSRRPYSAPSSRHCLLRGRVGTCKLRIVFELVIFGSWI
jgi:hypothetical protein